MSLTERMYRLFESSTRSRGVWKPRSKQHMTEHDPYTIQHFKAHLEGKLGIGLVPINDLNACKWGAIDIDAHGDREKIDIPALYSKVQELALPLLVCRSKSGGAHVYLFMEEQIDAKSMRASLRLLANKIGYPDAEVFPKQDTLDEKRLGNWINLPYFDVEHTERYCYIKKPISFEHFIETAEAMQQTAKSLEEVLLGDHSEAPPCVQQMLSGKVPNGFRNEGLFGIAIYMKKAYPEDWKDRMRDVNITTFEQPLQSKEVETVLGSVDRRDYKYRCKEEPCKAFCQAKVCLTRVHGIKPEDDPNAGDMVGMRMMEITGITKVLTEPPVYFVDICGAQVKVSADKLYNPMAMCVVMLEQADLIVYPMKPKEWHNMLAGAIQTLQREEAPEDASEAGIIRIRMREFLKKARDGVSDADNKEFLAHGQPVILEADGEKFVYFKGSSFVDHLRRTKSSIMKGPDLWSALRSVGIEHVRMRVAGKPTNVWRARYDAEEPMPGAKLKQEF